MRATHVSITLTVDLPKFYLLLPFSCRERYLFTFRRSGLTER